ncbi:MAG: ice-binding family protein [Planctomycetota bacterium]
MSNCKRISAAVCGVVIALLLVAMVAGCKNHRSHRGVAGAGASPPILAGAGTGVGGLGRGPAPVDLGTAENHTILAKSAISTVPASVVTGSLGLSPAAASFITGFSLNLDPSGTFSTSTQVSGHVVAADYTDPAPADLTVAVLDMEAAYADAAGRAPDHIELGAGNIGGLTLPPAVYKWGTAVLIPTDVTLSGGPNDVWIFQIAQSLTMSSSTQIVLAGGALSKNIFWQVFGAAEIGTTSHLEGILLSQTSIVANTGASVNGRLLAQTAVTLDSSTVTQPAP